MLLFSSNLVSQVSEEHMTWRWGKLLAKVLHHGMVCGGGGAPHFRVFSPPLHYEQGYTWPLTDQEHLSPEERWSFTCFLSHFKRGKFKEFWAKSFNERKHFQREAKSWFAELFSFALPYSVTVGCCPCSRPLLTTGLSLTGALFFAVIAMFQSLAMGTSRPADKRYQRAVRVANLKDATQTHSSGRKSMRATSLQIKARHNSLSLYIIPSNTFTLVTALHHLFLLVLSLRAATLHSKTNSFQTKCEHTIWFPLV